MKLLTILIAFLLPLSVLAQSDSTLAEYKGTYTFPEGSQVTSAEVQLRDGKLYISSAIGGSILTQVSRDTFHLDAYNGQLYFRRKAGKVSGIYVEVGQMILDGEKEETSKSAFRRPRIFMAR
ncbi:hypothetical protein EPD60_10415 [Flaviaesturariibacter flavus]|uniref:DUF3471 domain-containing protein n=1 Tax=Flaviaesturariibacter flavus TaxID=2502780 RepID=A0A4R1BBQ8_9BACT|nr:hypothetical protein [Flaviaesturariibacter flavus]TCJ14397.1 hypothetical protein EPD60_10415 [Flaviaesturariibacter flavus]